MRRPAEPTTVLAAWRVALLEALEREEAAELRRRTLTRLDAHERSTLAEIEADAEAWRLLGRIAQRVGAPLIVVANAVARELAPLRAAEEAIREQNRGGHA